MKRWLFLDIDGVIAGENEWGIMLEDKSCAFSRAALDALEYIMDTFPDTQIVISSTWRKGTTVEELQQIFKYRGFKYWQNITDKTVVLSFERLAGLDVNWYMCVPRGCEIDLYIRTHSKAIGAYKYVILDDESDMMCWQKDNFVHTKTWILTMEDAEKAIQILR